jgi:RHS repeat-associated protein
MKRYRFCGKERDGESGLYYYGARYYAPWCCRFVSVDPLAEDMPWATPYSYAANNPIAMVDVDGLAPGGGGNSGPEHRGKYEGEEARTTSRVKTTVAGIHPGSEQLIEVDQVTNWVWQSGTEENCYEDAKWMEKSQYEQFIYERVASKSTLVADYSQFVPWLYNHSLYKAPYPREIGIKVDTRGTAFFEAYRNIQYYLEHPVSHSQGIEDRSLDMVFMIEGGVAIHSLLRKGGQWASSKFISNGDEFAGAFDDAGKALGPGTGTNGPITLGKEGSLAITSDLPLLKPIPGFVDVIAHGSPTGLFESQGGNMVGVSIGEVCNQLAKQGLAGKPIRLVACNAGAISDGIAQQLANATGKLVIAPTQLIHIWPNGLYSINSAARITGDWVRSTGRWRGFFPK